MAKLHCSLAGFTASDALDIENLARLIRPRLSAEWSFTMTGGDGCDLLLCDIDSVAGAAAWQRSATRGGARAAATLGFLSTGGLTLNKPVQVHGPGGIVHILNEAAQLGKALAAPSLPVSGAAAQGGARPKLGWLRSFFRTILAWLSRRAADPPVSHVMQMPEVPASALVVDDEAEPAQRTYGILLPHTPAQSRTADRGPDAPSQGGTAVIELDRPKRQAASRTASAAAGTVVVPGAAGCNLLDLLRQARATSQVIVVHLRGLPAICAAPTIETGYSFTTLQAMFDSPAEALVPAHVSVAQNSYYGRNAVQPTYNGPLVSVPGFPLRNLFWVAVLRCGGTEEVARYRGGTFKLQAMPDLPGLPQARHHVTWCSLLGRRAMTAAALARATGHDADEAALFLAACDELGILKCKELPPELVPALTAASSYGLGHAARFRGVRNRLGSHRT
jgi:hypothetical protein